MAILIGIKQVQTSGGYHGAEGFETFSMDGTQFHILREDTHNELIHYVETLRENAKKAEKDYDELENKMERIGNSMSNDQFNKFDKQRNELLKIIRMVRYDKFLILEGRTI